MNTARANILLFSVGAVLWLLCLWARSHSDLTFIQPAVATALTWGALAQCGAILALLFTRQLNTVSAALTFMFFIGLWLVVLLLFLHREISAADIVSWGAPSDM
jgi:hypothetical protein